MARLIDEIRGLHEDAARWALVCAEFERSLSEDVLQTVAARRWPRAAGRAPLAARRATTRRTR